MINREKVEMWVTEFIGIAFVFVVIFVIGMFGWSFYSWTHREEPEKRCLLTEKQKEERLLGHVYFCNMSTGELYGEQWKDSWYNETRGGWEPKDRYWAGSGIVQEQFSGDAIWSGLGVTHGSRQGMIDELKDEIYQPVAEDMPQALCFKAMVEMARRIEDLEKRVQALEKGNPDG